MADPRRAFLVFTVGFFSLLGLNGRADGPNLIAGFNAFTNTTVADNPWGGVSEGVLTVPPGVQAAVNDQGAVAATIFSPSVAVGDLNGDGLQDLVVADAKGYFWFYPNSGSPTVPKFTSGEVMPIWIGDPMAGDGGLTTEFLGYVQAQDNTVPRIQLVDYSNEKKLSIVAGNYQGKLFFIHNVGTSTQPAFSMPQDLKNITVDTYSDHHLWCNFLAPFLYDFTGNGHLDLLLGEGTYASNSIYRLNNTGNNGSPVFSEKFTEKVIRGLGREHLAPQVVDWDNDGKPDVITGERAGFVNVFLNKSADPAHLKFDDGQHVRFGNVERLGVLTTVAVADLTGNKLPNLVFSNADDHLSYGLNTGKPGAPEFAALAPIAGQNPFPKIHLPPPIWTLNRAFSMPYVLLCCSSLKEDPEFVPPEPGINSVLKIYTVPHQHTYFQREVFPQNDFHIFACNQPVALQGGAHYKFSFWIRTTGSVVSLVYLWSANEDLKAQGIDKPVRGIFMPTDVSTGANWSHYSGSLAFPKADPHKEDTAGMYLYFGFRGNGGSISLAGFSLVKEN